MKTASHYSTLFIVMLILFFLAGCGKGEDKAKETVPEAIAPKVVVKQKTDLPAENNTSASQKAEPVQVTETQPTTKATDDRPIEPTEVTESEKAAQGIADVIMIENQGYESDRKGPVKFSHLKHSREYKVSCVECHHLYQEGKNIWREGDHVDRCVVCHDPVEEKEKAVKLQGAFHNNCRDCHTKASEEGREAPYKKCSGCHGERGQDV